MLTFLKATSSILFVLIVSKPSHAFFGGMFNTFMGGPQQWMQMPAKGMVTGMKMAGMDPVKMMLSMCNSPMGSMGASAFNSMGWAVAGNEMISEMQRMMMDPQQVVRAIDCASHNYQIYQVMDAAIQRSPTLLYALGYHMMNSQDVAQAVVRLANTYYGYGGSSVDPRGFVAAEMLFRKMDPYLFSQMTMAMIKFPDMVPYLVEMVRRHKHIAMDFRAPLLNSMMYWGKNDKDDDGTEKAMERFIFSVLSEVTTANAFFSMMEDLDDNTKLALMDVLFLGHRFDVQKDGFVRDKSHKNQGQLQIYALIDGLYESIMGQGKDAPTSLEEVDPSAMELMMNMMKYMIDKDHNQTEWGKAFLQALTDSIFIHSSLPTKNGEVVFPFCSLEAWKLEELDDPSWRPSKHQRFFCLLSKMMKRAPGFSRAQPQPNPGSIAPRLYN